MDRIIGGKYKLGRKIGSGSCGDVHEATQIGTSELVAVKTEKGDTRRPQLMVEATIYNVLQGKCGIPKIMWSGKDSGNNILVLELLGPNLQSLLEQCGGKFTKKTILMLAVQMIGRIEYMHSKGFLHRDIKPENFVMGVGERRHQVFIIDFGLAKAYLDPITNRHIPYRRVKNIVGTPRYASCNTYYLHEQSRRDDLLSLGYVLLYFLKGRLPWQGLRYLSEEQKCAMIGPMKLTFHKFLSELLPTGLASYFGYCKGLEFDQTPDYGFLKNLFHDWYNREGYRLDGFFDWTSFKYQRAKRTTASPRLFRRAKLPPPEPTIPDVPIMHEANSQVQSQPLPLLHDHESSVGSSSRQTHTV